MEALQIVWFILWGTLWAVYFMLDGFDFGACMLRPFLAKDEKEMGASLVAIGPVWNGNEVWLLTAGGATFAAFPTTYASMFSFLYLPLLLILFALIIRGVAVEFRNKRDGARWKKFWDWAMAISSLVAPLVLMLGFGNIFQGLKISATGYEGTFFGLFNLYGLLTAVFFVVLFLQHGALWLKFRTGGELAKRAEAFATKIWIFALILAVVFLAATPLATQLFNNFLAAPLLFAVPLLAAVCLLLVRVFIKRELLPFVASCLVIVLVTATGLIGLFPNLIPSSLDPNASLTAFNSSSSQLTLTVMTVVAAIFVPIVIVYQFVIYRLFRTKAQAWESY